MAEEAATDGTQAEPTVEGQEPTPDTQAEPGAAGQSDAPNADDLKKVRAEAQSLRTRLKAAEEKLKAEDDAKLSEVERLRKQVTDVQAELETTRSAASETVLEADILVAAQGAKLINPRAAVKLIDRELIERGEDGRATNLPDVVAALVKAEPYLVATAASPSGGSPANSAGSRTGPLTADQLRGMTPAQVAALPPEQVAAALSGG